MGCPETVFQSASMFALRDKLQNHLTRERDTYDRSRITSEFPILQSTLDDYYLSLRRHLDNRPEKFFSRTAYRVYLDWLQRRDAAGGRALENYFSNYGGKIEQALLFLREVNVADWHDSAFAPEDEYDLLLIIDRHVHPTYLRLVEAVLTPLIQPIAYFSRVDQNKGTDGLNVWPIIQELRRTSESCLTLPYRHIIRNGIAHGGISFQQRRIVYRDNRGNEEDFSTESIIRCFDDLLDVCNGIAVGLKVFFLVSPRKAYVPPREIRLEELQEETRSPWWTIVGSVETEIPGKSQLIIYARPDTRCYDKVLWSSVQSGILAEFFAPGYDRYFFSLRSKKALPGWIGFDGTKLKKLREAGADDLSQYKGVIEDDLLFYIPQPRPHSLFCRLGTLVSSFKVQSSLAIQRYREQMERQFGIPRTVCRSASIHRNSWAGILHASVVIEGLDELKAMEIIGRNRRGIVKSAQRRARQENRFNLATYLPLGFAQVAVFRRDYRRRRLASFGLGDNLICTVSFQRLNQINRPDILGSTIETRGKWRIAWNQAWLQANVNKQEAAGDEKGDDA